MLFSETDINQQARHSQGKEFSKVLDGVPVSAPQSGHVTVVGRGCLPWALTCRAVGEPSGNCNLYPSNFEVFRRLLSPSQPMIVLLWKFPTVTLCYDLLAL